MQNEIWKDIPGYEGFYQASSSGLVRSVNRNVFMKRNNCYKNLKGKIKRFSTSKHGYFLCQLSKEGVNITYSAHKLIAMTFLDHVPDFTLEKVVNHINFNKKDNRVLNLEIVTQRENANRKHIKSTSKYVGVFWNKTKKKWIASISYKSKKKYLGAFDDEYKASLAYQNELNK